MSFAVWLVIFIYKGHGSDYCLSPPGNIFHLRFNSEMLVLCGRENILREWYSLDTKRTDIDYFATWNSKKGIVEMVQKSLYERRNNLQGLAMKSVVVKDSLFFHMQDDKFGGIFGNIFCELCATLNFSLNIVSEVDEYGSRNLNDNTWSGAIGEIYSGRADISLSEFSMTSARLNVVDFSFPIIISKNSFFLREPNIFAVKWSTYFQTFTYPVWITIFLILIAASILLIFLKMKIGTDRDLIHLGSDICFEVWGIFCQQGLEDFPRRTSLKVAYYTMFLFVTVLSAAYSASLTSFLTSNIHVKPFSSLETFVKDGTYKYFVYRGSNEFDLFVNSESPLKNKLMKLKFKKDKLPTSLLDAFNMICENPKLTMYIDEKAKDQLSSKLPCDIISVKEGGIQSLSIILSKHSAFTGIINFWLQKFFHNGMVNRLKDTTYKNKLKRPVQEHIPVSIFFVVSLISFILISIAFSVCILFIEKYVHSRKMKKQSVVNFTRRLNHPNIMMNERKV
ncbi:PREDICTED: glutamate receptor 1-like [Polistes dominula]|uniref:Glutamate receptor 1-like n=1 Tax=Polistes dominula TaxID=743375 RepID=A0ABM1JBQ2_POLDO|nr:PREDICTED: glutamate receptor 1-like [Polistes dominula]